MWFEIKSQKKLISFTSRLNIFYDKMFYAFHFNIRARFDILRSFGDINYFNTVNSTENHGQLNKN